MNLKIDLQYLIGFYYIFIYSLQDLLILGSEICCKSASSEFKDMDGDNFWGQKCPKVLYILGQNNIFAKEQNLINVAGCSLKTYELRN